MTCAARADLQPRRHSRTVVTGQGPAALSRAPFSRVSDGTDRLQWQLEGKAVYNAVRVRCVCCPVRPSAGMNMVMTRCQQRWSSMERSTLTPAVRMRLLRTISALRLIAISWPDGIQGLEDI